MSRNSRLTADVVSALIVALRCGKSISEACKSASIGRTTFYGWLAAGHRNERGYAEFRARVFAALEIGDRARLDEVLAALHELPAPAITPNP